MIVPLIVQVVVSVLILIYLLKKKTGEQKKKKMIIKLLGFGNTTYFCSVEELKENNDEDETEKSK